MLSSDGSGARRAKLHLVRELVLFCFPLLIGWMGLEWWTAKLPDSYQVKRRHLVEISDQVDTLITGSSAAYWGISPHRLSGTAYSLANVSQTLYYDDRLVTKVICDLPRLKRVIVTFSYISMFSQLYDSRENWRQYYYAQKWQIPPARWRDCFDSRMSSGVILRTPRVVVDSVRTALRALRHHQPCVPLCDEPEIDDRGGWRSIRANDAGPLPDLSPASAQTGLDRHHGEMHLAYEAANLEYLEHLVSTLRRRHIEVVFVVMPAWHTYSAGMRPEFWNRAEADCKNLARKYGARYLSFLNAPGLQAGDFLDTFHLNPDGAVKFSKLLDAELTASPSP